MHQIPAWLDAFPDPESVAPPVDTRAQTLPLNALSWQDFERLVVRLIRRESQIIDCNVFGVPGQSQEGIDILGVAEGEPSQQICYQCKRVQSFSPRDIEGAVTRFKEGKFMETAKKLVLCVSIPLERNEQVVEFDRQRASLEAIGIQLVKWDGAVGGPLIEALKRAPELVDDFFGRPWVERFNGNVVAAGLGTRLDRQDNQRLLLRLRSLYSTLFNQHDPGPATPDGTSAIFSYRYVQPHLLETRRVGAASAVDSVGGDTGPDSPNTPSRFTEATGTHAHRAAHRLSELTEVESRRSMFDWLKGRRFGTVLGDAGYGKSALLRYIALGLLGQEDTLTGSLDPYQQRLLPIWLSFAALSSAIERNPALSVEDYFLDWLHRYGYQDVGPLLARALRNSEILFLVDGLDEVHEPGKARIALDRLVLFLESTGGHVLCTSRPRGFNALGVPGAWTAVRLAPFNDAQITELASRCLAVATENPKTWSEFHEAYARANSMSHAFVAALLASPRTLQLARTPLLCRALLDLFRTAPRLPEDRAAIYDEIINVLLSQHPSQRARAADDGAAEWPSLVSLRDLRRMLGRLALDLQRSDSVTTSPQTCSRSFSVYLEDSEEGLGRPAAEARAVAETVVGALLARVGILVERAPAEYGFLHLSIQEFLAAEALAERPDEEQISWVLSNWRKDSARDWLLNWFGIQGARGRKKFAGDAAAGVMKAGQTGALEGMRALELCVEIACTDLGLPVREAREYVQAAWKAVVESPFLEHQITLARSVSTGAISSAVSDECVAALRTWVPGRSAFQRANIIKSLSKWEPADDLRRLLFRALRDEELLVRRASAESLARVFAGDASTAAALRELATSEPTPETRAVALYALSLEVRWKGAALECAEWNAATSNDELNLEVVRTRVTYGTHTQQDLEHMRGIWENEALDFWLRDNFYALLLEGWRTDTGIRTAFLKAAQDDGRMEDEQQLSYLVQAFPRDDEVAALIARRIRSRGLNFASFSTELWTHLKNGYRGHPLISSPLTRAIEEFRKEREVIFWHPAYSPAYVVVGDNDARNAVIAAYEATARGRDRYWVANTLFDGWGSDPEVRRQLLTWATSDDIELSAPLARWTKDLLPVPAAREAWLLKHAAGAPINIATDSITRLLQDFPSADAISVARQRLTDKGLWYYKRIEIEALLAAADPGSQSSEDLRHAAFIELDGPPIAPWVKSIEGHVKWRARVLNAAAPARRDVRLAVAAVLRARVASGHLIAGVLPEPLAESFAPVRTAFLCALARASLDTSGSPRDQFEMELVEELKSTGTYHMSRRLSALAALLEMGLTSKAVEVLAEPPQRTVDWTHVLIQRNDLDVVAVQTILSHWQHLERVLEANQLSTQLPIDDIIESGNAHLLTQVPELSIQLDQRLTQPRPDSDSAGFLQLILARNPDGEMARSLLIKELRNPRRNYGSTLEVVKLLAVHFRQDAQTWNELAHILDDRGFGTGVIGCLAYGWPEKVHELDSIAKRVGILSPIDELLLATVAGEQARFEAAASALFRIRRGFWMYRDFLVDVLRMWAELPLATEQLRSWSELEDASRSMSAVALLAEIGRAQVLNFDLLRSRFNAELSGARKMSDGFDLVSRRSNSWCLSVLRELRKQH